MPEVNANTYLVSSNDTANYKNKEMKLPKAYDPKHYEPNIYSLWEKSESFKPVNRGDEHSFSIVMPPPNANGNLHIGHALTTALQDILIRYNRMKGKASLYLPGADHAGFETWVVYEKELNKQGKTRFDFSREELYKQVWDFVQLNKSNFESQLRTLGASCDWSRYTFTLDQKVVNQAYKTFKKMWDDKLIYRGDRLVNFCTFHGTSFSDIEVTYQDVPGHLWYIKYPLTDGSGSVTVATTRPETMLGDTAVAVNPNDSRFSEILGKTVKLPLTQREIPIINDDMVDMEFGTGSVKITPAHDPNDFEVAQRHDLPMISVIDHEGNMTHDVPPAYAGHDVMSARQLIVDDLTELGFIEKVEDYNHSVGHCYKCGTIIQPLLREQWFIDMKPLANRAIKSLRAGEINFFPSSKLEQSIAYLKNIKDWNISRQIAWGIPIPAFQNVDDPDDWIYDERVNQEIIKLENNTYRRDMDVFDTWFSSGQWSFVTLDYPSEDSKTFYPLDIMETGFDILYQWVCRMIMMGLYVTDSVPFKNVYLHGMVLDEHGIKMSKSKGNVINPMDMVEKFGSDALRMGVITGMTAGNNQPFGEPKVVAARNFCNKLWNIARFVEDKLPEEAKRPSAAAPKTSADHWILNKLNYLIASVSKLLDEYRFSEAYEQVYHFVWDDLADWYIESSKAGININVLVSVLENTLKIAHPFAPFVTETIWQTLYPSQNELLITSNWPQASKTNEKDAQIFEEIKNIITEVRYVKGELSLKGLCLYHTGNDFLKSNKLIIKTMAGLEDVREVKDGQGLNLTSTKHNCWLDVDQQAIGHFIKRLETKKQAQEKIIEQLNARLSNKDYQKNAPSDIVRQTKDQLKEAEELLNKVSVEIKRFSV